MHLSAEFLAQVFNQGLRLGLFMGVVAGVSSVIFCRLVTWLMEQFILPFFGRFRMVGRWS